MLGLQEVSWRVVNADRHPVKQIALRLMIQTVGDRTDTCMNLYEPTLTEEHGIHILTFRRDELGIADLDQVRHYFAHRFLTETSICTRLVIDLTGVATLDSACLGPLVQRLRLAQQKDGQLALCGVDSPALEEIFALTRFDKVFIFYKTRTDAVAAIAR